MGASEAFGRLNERQREAACAGPGPLLILAGAGTGKTNTLAHRVAHLVLTGAQPERILLLTFTRRAAGEMTRRAQRIVGEAAGRGTGAVRLPWSGTFHAVANRLIRRHCARVGLRESFSVLDRGDAADLLDVVRHDLGFSKTEKRFPRKDTCLAICSHRVNTQGTLEATLKDVFPWCGEWVSQLNALFLEYTNKKLSNQALDYDDLLLYWHAMMADEDLAAEIGALWDHVLVDEYQDTNALQAQILARLRPAGEGLTVVGDDAQAIYSFRAATVENILNFHNQFKSEKQGQTTISKSGNHGLAPGGGNHGLSPGGGNHGPSPGVVVLEENYRSTQEVLDAANALMNKNLKSNGKNGARPRYVTVADEGAQAKYVVERVLETREQGVELRRQAVLFRAAHHSDVLELELVRRNIPYVKYGGLKFLEAAHVKDLLAVLRWADNPRNRVAAWRALQLLPGVGPRGAERTFTGFEAKGFSWGELKTGSAETDELFRNLGNPETAWPGQMARVREWYAPALERKYDALEVRTADLVQLEKISAGYQTREQFLTELALDPPAATGDLAGEPLLDEDYLVLSTVHSAKGQEWESVHLLHVTDGNFPNEFRSEERRVGKECRL